MKRLLFVFAVCVSLGMISNSYAQFRIGLKGGANLNKMDFKIEDLDTKNMTSFHIGPMVEFDFPVLPLAIEAAALFTQKGVTYEDGGISKTLKSNVIETPINVRLSVFRLFGIRAFLSAGPYFTFQLNNNLDDVAKDVAKLGDMKAQKVGMGLNAGGGIDVGGVFMVHLQYGAMMTDGYKFDISKVVDDYKGVKDKTISLSLGVRF